jgi:hypothetical protein
MGEDFPDGVILRDNLRLRFAEKRIIRIEKKMGVKKQTPADIQRDTCILQAKLKITLAEIKNNAQVLRQDKIISGLRIIVGDDVFLAICAKINQSEAAE